jgi:DnaJ-class molecular chaperone
MKDKEIEIERHCEHCKDMGVIDDSIECPYCGGLGVIIDTEHIAVEDI